MTLRLPQAFEDAIMAFVADKGAAADELVATLCGLTDDEWETVRPVLLDWIERGCAEAPAYKRVVERVDYCRDPRWSEA